MGSETIWLMIGGVIGAIMQGVIGPWVIARYSRPKDERNAALAEVYLKLADMTADQLEEKINLVVKLHSEVIDLKTDNEALRKKQLARDEQIGILESQLAAVQVQINLDTAERADLREKLAGLDKKYRVLWQYLIASLEHMRKHLVKPLDPPAELQSDPEIIRILKETHE